MFNNEEYYQQHDKVHKSSFQEEDFAEFQEVLSEL